MSYTPEEAEAILTRAVGRKTADAVSHDRLLAMADELGIAPEDIEATVMEMRREQEDKALRREFIAERRATFWPHLIPYLSVNLFLVVLCLMTRWYPLLLAIFSILGWGIGLVSHALAVLPTSGPEFEKEFARWKQGREKRAQRKTRRSTKKTEQVTESETAVQTEAPAQMIVDAPPRQTTVVREEKPQTLQQRSGR